jgi:hypothetical protein
MRLDRGCSRAYIQPHCFVPLLSTFQKAQVESAPIRNRPHPRLLPTGEKFDIQMKLSLFP